MSVVGREGVVVTEQRDFPPGSRMTVDAFGTRVAVFNVEGTLFAVDNHCPHQGGPLCHGGISGAWLPSDPYEFQYGRRGRILTCPWHGWQFDLESGQALFDPLVRVPRYDVRIVDEKIVVYEPISEPKRGKLADVEVRS